MLTTMLLAQMDLDRPTPWVLLAAGVALVFSIRRWRMISMNKKKTSSLPASAAGNGSHGPALNVREVATELQALLADLEETSRRLTAQLDNRYTRLELLLAEADEKIRRLEALSNGAGSDAAPVFEANKAAAGGEAGSSPRPRAAGTAGIDPQRTLERLRQERGAPAPTDDPAYQPIYHLADRGQSPREIAQQLGRQPGEIELILALRQRS